MPLRRNFLGFVSANFPASFWSPQGSSGRDLGFWVNYIFKGAILVEKHSEKDVSILSKLHPPSSKVVSLRCLHQKSAASKLVSGRDLFNRSLLTGPSKVLKVILFALYLSRKLRFSKYVKDIDTFCSLCHFCFLEQSLVGFYWIIRYLMFVFGRSSLICDILEFVNKGAMGIYAGLVDKKWVFIAFFSYDISVGLSCQFISKIAATRLELSVLLQQWSFALLLRFLFCSKFQFCFSIDVSCACMPRVLSFASLLQFFITSCIFGYVEMHECIFGNGRMDWRYSNWVFDWWFNRLRWVTLHRHLS